MPEQVENEIRTQDDLARDNRAEKTHAEGPRSGKKKIIVRVIILLAIAALAYGGYRFWVHLSDVESTDDAEIDGQIHAISSRVGGQVTDVLVLNEQFVNKGDVLLRLDPQDYQIAIDKAKADLADATATLQSAQADVPITSVTSASTLSGARSSSQDAGAAVSAAEQQLQASRAKLQSAEANVRVAEANLAKAQGDVDRYKSLVNKDEISKQTYDQAAATAAAARATVDAQNAMVAEARQNISVSEQGVVQARARLAQTESTVESASTGPQQVKMADARVRADEAKVQQEKAALDQAELNLQYTTVVAPASGIVGMKTVTVGQNVTSGEQLMAVVPLDGLYVTANFKETQLKNMRVGQPVKIKVDAYGREYSGKVQDIGGASGAKFSLLPPENATGNYVKVIQRIPVRIEFNPGQDKEHLLRLGMSVDPTVSVR